MSFSYYRHTLLILRRTEYEALQAPRVKSKRCSKCTNTLFKLFFFFLFYRLSVCFGLPACYHTIGPTLQTTHPYHRHENFSICLCFFKVLLFYFCVHFLQTKVLFDINAFKHNLLILQVVAEYNHETNPLKSLYVVPSKCVSECP